MILLWHLTPVVSYRTELMPFSLLHTTHTSHHSNKLLSEQNQQPV